MKISNKPLSIIEVPITDIKFGESFAWRTDHGYRYFIKVDGDALQCEIDDPDQERPCAVDLCNGELLVFNNGDLFIKVQPKKELEFTLV